MPCLLLILFVLFPRIALLLLFFFSHYISRAYHGFLLPLLGFIFLPLTTLVYAWMVNNGQPTTGINLIILIIAVVIDVGGLGGGAYHRRTRVVKSSS
jgi:predicted MFS family arabinose efflux permease